MLKLRYLFDNRDLALMLLENWKYDKDALNMLDNYRISGNAIYPYKYNGKIYFLRFTPWNNITENEINEEIKFIQYLNGKRLNVLKPVLSKNGNYLLAKNTPWGKYLVCAFERVEGEQMDGFNSDGDYTDELITGYGKILGKLHKHSSEYGKVTKKSYFEKLEEMDIFIKDKLDDKETVRKEINEIRNLLQKIPKNKLNYGLIHGDYELDNVFYDKNSKNYSIIDFESGIYHWYAMDVVIALNNIKEELPHNDYERMEKLFINGYNEEYQISDEEIKYFPLFERFENLRKYIGLKFSLEETWDNEPSWMLGLRDKLNKYTLELESNFK
jgi:Ser/Thr protein kinase RdoA (MazF antagonist)